jgi:TRAP-type C4-dicarboxylate transport system substrate-binding protein
LATIAPDGTAWARELRAFSRDVEGETKGQLGVKWYFGAIAGDEVQVDERMMRGQVDGFASGGMLCLKHSTTMRALRLMGVVQNDQEATVVLNRMREQIGAEFAAAGYELLGVPVIGTDLLFLNRMPADLAELRTMRLWRWDLDEVAIKYSRALGLDIKPLPISDVSHALDQKQIEGVIAVPTAALAFQWAAHTKVLVRMPLGVIPGCFVITQRAFNRLPIDQQNVVRGAAAKAIVRFLDLQKQQDEALLGSLFEKQGLRVDAPPDMLRTQYYAAVRVVRDKVAMQVLPKVTLDRIMELLADFRAEHQK